MTTYKEEKSLISNTTHVMQLKKRPQDWMDSHFYNMDLYMSMQFVVNGARWH